MNAVLWNFDIDGIDPKPSHYSWLEGAVKRVNGSHYSLIWNISVTGNASLTGFYLDPNNGHNWSLARDRANMVNGYLKAGIRTPGAVFNPPWNAGSMFAGWAHHPIGVENDEDRSVFVMITTDSPPPPPPRTPVSIPLSTEWAIRYSSGGSGGVVIGVDSALYDIADTKNHIHSYYEYSGDIVGWSPEVMPISITGAGSWTTFSTSDAINIADFDGACRFTTGGAGPFSKNYLRLTPKAGATTTPNPLEIDTGFTFGVGASVTIPGTGWLSLKSRRPLPYTGTFPP